MNIVDILVKTCDYKTYMIQFLNIQIFVCFLFFIEFNAKVLTNIICSTIYMKKSPKWRGFILMSVHHYAANIHNSDCCGKKTSAYFNAFVLWSTLKQPTAAAAALPLPFCCAFVSKRIWPLLLSAQLLLRGWSVQNQNRGWFTFNCQMLLHALPEWIGQTMFSMLLSQIFWETKCMWFNVHRFSDKDDDSTMVVNGIDNMWRWTHIHTTRWDQRLLIKMNITKSYLVDNNDWTA